VIPKSFCKVLHVHTLYLLAQYVNDIPGSISGCHFFGSK
jgi:hypothetical protein